MPFSFGGNSSTTNSTSSSYDRSSAGSVSGGGSASASQDSIAFEDVFARLFGGAEGAAAGLDPSMLTGAANSLFSSGSRFMDSIGGDAGSQYLSDRLGGGNEVLQQQIDLLGEDLGKFFNEQINPAITSEAVAGGQLGGGRQGVAQGMAASEVGSQFTRGATALRAGDINARDSAAGVLAQNTVQGAGVGFAGIPAVAGAAQLGYGAELDPYARLAAILGGPTTLNTAGSASADFARSFSESLGVSSASSTTRSKGFNFEPV